MRPADDLTAVPHFLLVRRFIDSSSGRYVAKAKTVGADNAQQPLRAAPCDVERVFYASGRPLVAAVGTPAADPYILLVRLRSSEGARLPDAYDLMFGAADALSPFYEGEGQYVSGAPCGLDADERLSLLGLESFRRPAPGTQDEQLLQCQSLFFQRVSDDVLLVLEFGSLGHVHDDEAFPDKALDNHLVESLEPATGDAQA